LWVDCQILAFHYSTFAPTTTREDLSCCLWKTRKTESLASVQTFKSRSKLNDPKKEFQNGELWRCIIASLIEMQICYFFLKKKSWKKLKSNESLRRGMQGMTTWSFSTVTKIAFNIFFFSKRFNWIVKIPKNGTQIHTNWTKNFSLNEIVNKVKPNIPFYQLFNKVI